MIQNARINNQIKQLPLFAGCDETEMQHHLARVTIEEGLQDDFHFKGLCVLLKGTARVMRKKSQGTMYMSSLKKGDIFGAATILNEDSFFAPKVQLSAGARILLIPEQEWLSWLHSDYTLMKNYLGYLNARLHFLNIRLDALSQSSIENRVMTFVRASAKNGAFEVESYTELALMLCVGRASLYRALDALEQEGLLVRQNKTIILKG